MLREYVRGGKGLVDHAVDSLPCHKTAEWPIRMPYIDTHAHLQLPHFDEDRDEVVQRARNAGVAKIIAVATDAASSRLVIALSEKYAGIFAAVGIHPNDCGSAGEAEFALIAKLAQHPVVVAIGEIGLDYYWKDTTSATQRRAFVRQLALARELQKPVIIHHRQAGAAILRTLHEENIRELRGVFHCFSADAEFGQRVLDLGCYVSFTGNLTSKQSALPQVAAQIPLTRLLLETDAPFMTPRFRGVAAGSHGNRNEPAFVMYIAEKLAEIKQLPIAEIATATTENAHRLFGL